MISKNQVRAKEATSLLAFIESLEIANVSGVISLEFDETEAVDVEKTVQKYPICDFFINGKKVN